MQRILLIHLGALGAVLRSTSLLKALHQKHPNAHLTWLTQAPAQHLLAGNPLIDQIRTLDLETSIELQGSEWDVVYCIDKSRLTGGILRSIKYDQIFGFCVDPYTQAILPATPEADELWQIGLSDQKKFFENQKSECQLVHEALELGPYHRDRYLLMLSESEEREIKRRKQVWGEGKKQIIGINTGCSGAVPYKKWTVEYHRKLIERLSSELPVSLVLLGGKTETVRNQQIAHGHRVYQSETEKGLRDGILSAAACDIIISGDSLGMHLGIALKKWVVAWFGPTCAHEIDLFDSGVKVLSNAPCGPCWKRSCSQPTMCYDLVDVKDVVNAVRQGCDRPAKANTSFADSISG